MQIFDKRDSCTDLLKHPCHLKRLAHCFSHDTKCNAESGKVINDYWAKRRLALTCTGSLNLFENSKDLHNDFQI